MSRLAAPGYAGTGLGGLRPEPASGLGPPGADPCRLRRPGAKTKSFQRAAGPQVGQSPKRNGAFRFGDCP